MCMRNTRIIDYFRLIDYEILNRFDATNVLIDFNRLRRLIVSALVDGGVVVLMVGMCIRAETINRHNRLKSINTFVASN